jgi:Fe-S cluster assembly protein SufD
LGNYLEAFTEFAKRASGQKQGWLRKLREDAFARFCEVGFPTTHDEDWRFTNVAPLARTRWGKPAEKWGVDVRPRKEFGRWVTFVNGRFAPQLSSDLPAGVDLLDVAHPRVQQHLGRYAPYQTQPFVALNTANLDEGIFLEIAKGAVIEEPIELVYLSNDMDGAATHPRNLILIGAHAQVSLVESFAGTSGRYFTNAVTEIVAGEGAVVDHYKLQMESADAYHMASMQVELARDVNFTSQSIALGAALARNDITAVLSEGTECTLNGFYLVNGTQHVDTHTSIDHAKPHGTSHELYKGILGGRANAVFNGKILVRKDAQKTDAKQTNKNLVLSEDATINTKPELQIFADDVRCTHGATIGQIDPESLFYLQARGIGRDEARSMLIVAFARDVLDRIKIEPLREMVERVVGERLARGL